MEGTIWQYGQANSNRTATEETKTFVSVTFIFGRAGTKSNCHRILNFDLFIRLRFWILAHQSLCEINLGQCRKTRDTQSRDANAKMKLTYNSLCQI